MSSTNPLVRIPVSVVVERRKAVSKWADVIWRPVAVLAGATQAQPWTPIAESETAATFYAGTADIELYRSESANYRSNLQSGTPSIWVMLQSTGGEPPYEIAAVTADPAEAEALTEPGQGIVEAVGMPDAVRDILASFVAEHHVEQAFEKRTRDRADPEALARRTRQHGNDDER